MTEFHEKHFNDQTLPSAMHVTSLTTKHFLAPCMSRVVVRVIPFTQALQCLYTEESSFRSEASHPSQHPWSCIPNSLLRKKHNQSSGDRLHIYQQFVSTNSSAFFYGNNAMLHFLKLPCAVRQGINISGREWQSGQTWYTLYTVAIHHEWTIQWQYIMDDCMLHQHITAGSCDGTQ